MYEEFDREWARCSTSGCPDRAMINRSFNKKPKANYCFKCYDLAGLNEALKWNHDNGLDTTEKRIAYVKKMSKSTFKPMPK